MNIGNIIQPREVSTREIGIQTEPFQVEQSSRHDVSPPTVSQINLQERVNVSSALPSTPIAISRDFGAQAASGPRTNVTVVQNIAQGVQNPSRRGTDDAYKCRLYYLALEPRSLLFATLDDFNEVLREIRCNTEKCGVGLLRGDACKPLCKTKRQQGKCFSFEQHHGFSRLACIRCGGEHFVKDCPTSRQNAAPGVFPPKTCGYCGFYRFENGHGVRMAESEPIFQHDLAVTQLLDKGWRKNDLCGSGLCDLFFPILYCAFKIEG